MNAGRFITQAIWTIQSTPKLSQCEPRSIIDALLHAATDGLLVDGRQSALVTYETDRDGRREMRCQYIPMIAGIRNKVFQAGALAKWDVQVVQAGDEFDYNKSTGWVHYKKSMRGGRTRPVEAVYSQATFPSGHQVVDVMNVDEIEDIRKKSKARHGPWADPVFYPEMAVKTIAKHHAKQLPVPEDVSNIFRREDSRELEMDEAAAPLLPSSGNPSSTREVLEQYAPKPEPPPQQIQDSENPAPPEERAEPLPSKDVIPKNAAEYVERFNRTLSTARDKNSAAIVRQWFDSAYEKRLRTKVGISFPDLDKLEADMKKHLSKFEEGGA
jgi:recombination protein RecT